MPGEEKGNLNIRVPPVAVAIKQKRNSSMETGKEQQGKDGDYTPSARIKQSIKLVLVPVMV